MFKHQTGINLIKEHTDGLAQVYGNYIANTLEFNHIESVLMHMLSITFIEKTPNEILEGFGKDVDGLAQDCSKHLQKITIVLH